MSDNPACSARCILKLVSNDVMNVSIRIDIANINVLQFIVRIGCFGKGLVVY